MATEEFMPLVSVIVPVYGVDKYIEESIKSICNQKYQNLEIIIVDDGSVDNSVAIAKRILEKSERPFAIISEENKGLPGARNTGLLNSWGEYVCFIDSDDIILDSHISNLIAVIRDNGLRVAFSDFEFTDETNREGSPAQLHNNMVMDREALCTSFMKRDPAIHCCTLLLEKKFLLEGGLLFNERLKYGEDVEFMWRVFSSIERIGRVEAKTYKYLIRNNSIMTTIGIERGEIFVKEFQFTVSELSKKYPEDLQLYKYVYYRTILGWLHAVATSSTYSVFSKALEVIDRKELKENLSSFPDKKVVVGSILLSAFPRAFFLISKRSKH